MMKINAQHKIPVAVTGLVFCVLFWAINSVVAKGVIKDIPPMALSFYRWVSALVFLFPFAYRGIMAEQAVIRENMGMLFLLSIPSVAAYNSFLYLGAVYTTANNISLVVAAMPAVTLGAAWLINRERTGPVQILGIGLALAGVLAIIAKGSLGTFTTLRFNPGDLLVVVSIFCWSLYSVFLRRAALPISLVPFLFMTVGFGVITILPFYLWELSVKGGFRIHWGVAAVFVYLGICPSILSYLFWNHGVKTLGAAKTSVFAYLIPVFTAGIAYIFLGERLVSYHFTGGAMILAGLVLSSRTS